MRISKILNAAVYVDGTNNLIGRAGEISLPEIATTTEEHKGLGMFGTVKIPTGLAALMAKVKWAGYYAEAVMFGANPFGAHKLQVRASVESFEAGGRVAEVPLTVFMTARWEKSPLGNMAPQASSEREDELSVTYLKIVLDGQELVEIDVLENVWKVGGTDLLANYRKNLGGS